MAEGATLSCQCTACQPDGSAAVHNAGRGASIDAIGAASPPRGARRTIPCRSPRSKPNMPLYLGRVGPVRTSGPAPVGQPATAN